MHTLRARAAAPWAEAEWGQEGMRRGANAGRSGPAPGAAVAGRPRWGT